MYVGAGAADGADTGAEEGADAEGTAAAAAAASAALWRVCLEISACATARAQSVGVGPVIGKGFSQVPKVNRLFAIMYACARLATHVWPRVLVTVVRWMKTFAFGSAASREIGNWVRKAGSLPSAPL